MGKETRTVDYDLLDGRIAPQNIEVEEQVLGILLQYRDAYTEATQIIDVECFYKDYHQLIFTAIAELEKQGKRADVITTTQKLREKGELETIGGAYAMTQIINKTSSPLQLQQYCCKLKELSMYRKLIEISHYLRNVGYTQDEDVFEAYSKANEMLSGALAMSSDSVFTIQDAVKGVTEQIDRNCAGESRMTGIATGFSDFDNRSGGLQGSDLVIIAAETSQGKTSLSTTIAHNASLKGAKIAYYSLEMTKEQLAARLMAIQTGIPAYQLLYARLTQQSIEHVHKNISKILNTRIYFDERSTNNIDNILSSIRALKIKYDIDIVIVDFLQLVGMNKKGLNKEQQTADVARSLKNIAKELNINVILLSQLSRPQNGDNMPKLSRLRDSGQIEEAADVVIFIYRPEEYGKTYPKEFENYPVKNTALIDVAKGRNIGLLKFIVSFNKEITHFFEYDESLAIPPTTEKTDPFLN